MASTPEQGAPGFVAPPGATGPPPGPGVQPPFVAAPIEGRRMRLGIGLGVAGGLLAACCGLGVLSGGGLLVLGERMVNEQAQAAVDGYLSAVVEQEWQEAYDQRCQQDRRAESLDQFAQRVSRQPQIEEYQVGDLRIEDGQDPLGFDALMAVPVDVAYADGTDTVLEVPVDQNPQTGEFEVCGEVTEA